MADGAAAGRGCWRAAAGKTGRGGHRPATAAGSRGSSGACSLPPILEVLLCRRVTLSANNFFITSS